jgi:hypothetical protein
MGKSIYSSLKSKTEFLDFEDCNLDDDDGGLFIKYYLWKDDSNLNEEDLRRAINVMKEAKCVCEYLKIKFFECKVTYKEETESGAKMIFIYIQVI